MATRYVDSDIGSSGDGTSWGAAKKTLSEAVALIPSSTLTEPWTINVRGAAADTTAFNLNGPVPTATNYILIQGDASVRPGTSWSTGKYRLETTDANPFNIYNAAYVRVSGLQIGVILGSDASRNGVYVNHPGASDIRLLNLLIRFTGAGAPNGGAGVRVAGSASGVTSINNLIVLGHEAVYQEAGTVYAYHVTGIKGDGSGVAGLETTSGATFVAKNCALSGYGNSVAYLGTFDGASRNCATDGTDDIGAGSGHLTSVTMGFTSATKDAEDVLPATGSGLIDAGLDLSADDHWFAGAYDIAGTARASWDIGAAEHASASAPSSLATLGVG